MLKSDRAEARHVEVLHMVSIAERNCPNCSMTRLLRPVHRLCIVPCLGTALERRTDARR